MHFVPFILFVIAARKMGVSMLTGTAFGTAATMGVISMTSGSALGADSVILGGAIVSVAYFGDRASPMSTGALLVSELTQNECFYTCSRYGAL